MVNIKEIAKAAGVSIATVSRVLSDHPNVSKKAKQKVLKAVKNLDYHPNKSAQSLRLKKSYMIGLVVHLDNPLFAQISRSIQDEAYKNNYNILLCDTNKDFKNEMQCFDLMQSENVAGIIFAPTSSSEDYVAKIESISAPVVTIDRPLKNSNVNSVLIDNEDAGYNLAIHLIQSGYKNISIIGNKASVTSEMRIQGILHALKYRKEEHTGVKVDLISNYSEVYELTKKIIKNKDTDVIITTNGLIAESSFVAIKESGKKVPEEIAFACFDETDWTNLVDPAITVVAQPSRDIGEAAVNLLLGKIINPEKSSQIVTIKSNLIVRGSTASKLK